MFRVGYFLGKARGRAEKKTKTEEKTKLHSMCTEPCCTQNTTTKLSVLSKTTSRHRTAGRLGWSDTEISWMAPSAFWYESSAIPLHHNRGKSRSPWHLESLLTWWAGPRPTARLGKIEILISRTFYVPSPGMQDYREANKLWSAILARECSSEQPLIGSSRFFFFLVKDLKRYAGGWRET